MLQHSTVWYRWSNNIIMQSQEGALFRPETKGSLQQQSTKIENANMHVPPQRKDLHGKRSPPLRRRGFEPMKRPHKKLMEITLPHARGRKRE